MSRPIVGRRQRLRVVPTILREGGRIVERAKCRQVTHPRWLSADSVRTADVVISSARRDSAVRHDGLSQPSWSVRF